MAKVRKVIDSYTQQEWVEPYTSPIPGIMQGRQSFYRRDQKGGKQAGYEITPVPSPEGSPSAAPSWELRRMACEVYPPQPLLTFPSPEQAAKAARWAVANDASVQIVLHWLTKKDIEPFIRLLDQLQELGNG